MYSRACSRPSCDDRSTSTWQTALGESMEGCLDLVVRRGVRQVREDRKHVRSRSPTFLMPINAKFDVDRLPRSLNWQ